METEFEGQESELPEGEEPAEGAEDAGGSEEPAQGAQGDTQEPEGQQPRQTRKDRQATRRQGIAQDRDSWKAKAEALERQMAHVAQGQKTQAGALSKLTDTLSKAMAKDEKSEVDQLEDRIDALLPRVASDPEAYKEYKKLQREHARAIAAEVAEDRIGKYRESQPSAPDPAELEAGRQFPWLRTNRAARDAVDATIAHLVERDRRNWGDPEMREATILEAAHLIAQTWKLPVRTATRSDGNAAARFSGTSGRGGAPGSGSVSVPLTDDMRSMMRKLGMNEAQFRKEILEPELKPRAR